MSLKEALQGKMSIEIPETIPIGSRYVATVPDENHSLSMVFR
jgi:hypothetical protein